MTHLGGTRKGSVAPIEFPVALPPLSLHEVSEDPPQVLVVWHLKKVKAAHVSKVGRHFYNSNNNKNRNTFSVLF